jgi:hypothetical protein
MPAIDAYRIVDQESLRMTAVMAVVPVFSNKCGWFEIKARAKQGVAVSDKTLSRRFKK